MQAAINASANDAGVGSNADAAATNPPVGDANMAADNTDSNA